MNFEKSVFQQRRELFFSQLKPNSLVIIPTSPQAIRSGDTFYPFRPASDFYYLTGFSEPEAIALLMKGDKTSRFILFNRSKDPIREIWEGHRAGQADACEIYGADESHSIENFLLKLPEFLQDSDEVYYPSGFNVQIEEQLFLCLQKVAESKNSPPKKLHHAGVILHEMRLFKSQEEIAIMRKSADITVQAHRRAVSACRPGLFEYELEGILLHEFCRHGARFPAYSSIVAAGANACCLHYVENNKVISDGDLVLIDAGAEYQYYAADLTRTFPANGQFTRDQQAVYEVVLAAQAAGFTMMHPGVTRDTAQNTVVRVITQGLVDLGILNGTVDGLIENKSYTRFYMHGLGHWLGLDVHDVGSYFTPNKTSRCYEPGMVCTVEPGIYIAPGSKEVNEKWWGIGIRIEDDVVITHTRCDILTKDMPKTVSEIEALCAGKSI